jgi:hypothetical protein
MGHDRRYLRAVSLGCAGMSRTLIAAIVALLIIDALALCACVPSDAGQCRPHTFQLGC